MKMLYGRNAELLNESIGLVHSKNNVRSLVLVLVTPSIEWHDHVIKLMAFDTPLYQRNLNSYHRIPATKTQ